MSEMLLTITGSDGKVLYTANIQKYTIDAMMEIVNRTVDALSLEEKSAIRAALDRQF
jgi:hypothetical protein